MNRYNHLVQTCQVDPPFGFYFSPEGVAWKCLMHRDGCPNTFEGVASRKREAKEKAVCQFLAKFDTSRDLPVTPEPLDFSVFVLVDSDSMLPTLRNLVPWRDLEWLTVIGFANNITQLPENLPWSIYRTEDSRRDGADHALTWYTAQLVNTLTERCAFLIVSRDASLQTTVGLIKEAGHQAYFHSSQIQTIDDVMNRVRPKSRKKVGGIF